MTSERPITGNYSEMNKMVNLAKMLKHIKNIFHVFRKVEKSRHFEEKNGIYIKRSKLNFYIFF